MGFWDLSEGGSATDTGTEYEQPGGGNFDPIPDGSDVLAMVEEAVWKNSEREGGGADFISLKWTITAPAEYLNRKVFQKLFVTDLDPSAKDEEKAIKKRDKARRMLAAIDANAGGKLGRSDAMPTDDSMTLHLCNKAMIIKCMVWEMPDRERHGEFIRGNWISAVKPKTAGVAVTAEPERKAAPKPQQRRVDPIDDDEIPF